MTDDRKSPGKHSGKDAMTRSFEKETAAEEQDVVRKRVDDTGRRSLMGIPVDPNSPTTKGNFPPGLPAEDAADPGRATPDAKPVDNRSGQPHGKSTPRK